MPEKVHKFEEGATMQVAMVVRDLEAEMKRHCEVFNIGPWDIFEVDNSIINPWIYRGKPVELTCRVAFAWSGDTQIEIIQPVKGYSIYDEHLERRGDGAAPHQALFLRLQGRGRALRARRLSGHPERRLR